VTQHPDWRAIKAGQEYGRIVEEQQRWAEEERLEREYEASLLCKGCGEDLMLTDDLYCERCVEADNDLD
jgi:predicted amidophosphoribosyltransferase